MTETPRPEGRTPSEEPDPQRQPQTSEDPGRIDDKKTRPSDSLDGTQGFAATLPSDGNISWDGKSSPPVERIGRYLLLEELGSGSFGVVYRALDEVLKRFVAVKLLSRFIDAGEVDSWMHEAQVLASLDHPAIVPVYDIGKTGADRPYIVSKYIGGGTLAQRVTPGGSSAADVVKIVTQLAEALHYLHRRGVMHRDIKPGNILMTEDDNAVLADFGLALPESGYGRGARFVGTPAYMSPEQARREGHRVDGRSDIYSLGVVFYELLTGTRPFRASNQEDLLDCIRSVDVRPPRQLKASVPKELERICLKALSKKVSDRYSTAGDLVEDLKNWQNSAPMLSTIGVSGMHAESNSPAASPSTPLSSPHSSQRSLDIHNVAVIPHGLRPFDAADSDFFKYLLPGARDRNGIPDSISFWTTRIRNREPDETFRVGVLLGPSGSGKSSLMRAGVLPLVASEVNAVYIEAKPEQLEGNLFKQIVHRVPHLKPEQGLREALIRYRQRHQETDGRKLLIVIDQFEQWLNYHREDQTSELHEALRQCDGVHIQAVLLVRDDFMLGLSVFMDQIEELLLQNRNFATVEPFGSSHAREVLAAFGRAYGELSDVLTPEQQKFLEEAIDDLQRLGKIEPVQLALLSEMMKDKPWTAATLKRLGGTQGLGVAFLNDRLLGGSAHPLIRSEADAVQRILAELLPADDTVIKPPATPEHVIMERLRGLKSDETLSRLLQLLDTEVRLLTPTSSSSSQGSTTGSTSGEPAYQLTHDYLVPTIRRWLQSLNQSSRSGRVRRQLRDIAAAWNALPSPKRLPSIIEWASIRALTSKRDWTDAESRMMRAMEKRLGAGTLIVSATISALFGGGYFAYVQSRSQDIVSRLKEVDTQEVAGVLSLVDEYRSWVVPKLAKIPLQDNPQIDADESRRRFHAALAQLDEKPEAVDLLYRKLGTIEDRLVEPALKAAQKHSHISPQSLIERLKQAIASPTGDVLPAAAMAASVQPNHEVWAHAAEPICRKLAEKRSNQLEHWLPMLRPVGGQLLPTILELGDQAALAQSPQLENYVMMINEFSKDDSAAIAAALSWPRLEQMDVLIAVAADRNRLAVEIRDRLQSMTTPEHRRSAPPPSAAVEAVKKHGGHLTSGGGWSQRVPTTELDDAIKNMAVWGFAPRSVRVVHTLTPSIAAVTWSKESSPTRYETDLSAAELMKKFDELQKDGWTMFDFCVLSEPNGKRVADADRRFSGLWTKHPNGKGPEQFLTLNIASDDEDPTVKLDNPDFWSTIRFAVSLSEEGKPKKHSLLQKFPSEPLNSVAWTKIRFGDGDRYPGFAQSDLRVTDTWSFSDRGDLWDIFIDAYSQISATGGDTNKIAAAAGYLSALGSHEEALELLGQIEDSHDQGLNEKERGLAHRRAALEELIAKLRMGRIDEVRTGLDDEKLGKKLSKPDRDYVTLRLAILDKDANAIRNGLDLMKSGVQARTASEIHYVHALGAAAAMEPDGSSESFKRLSDELTRIVENGTKLQLESVVLDVDFDPLRAIPEWHSLLHRLGFTERFARCSIVNEQLETKTLELLPTAEHYVAAQQLIDQGFLPIAVEVTTSGNKSDASEANQRVTSLWQRSAKSPERIAEDAERIGRYCLALSKLGEQDALRDALHDRWGRSVQSYTTAQAERSIEPDELVRLLRAGEASGDPAPIISALGGFKRDRFKPDDLRYLLTQLKNWSTSAERSELLNVSRWCLGSLGESVEPLPISQAPNKRSNWSTNSLGLQMVEIQVPEVVLVGKVDLDCLWHKVNRKIQVSSTEIRGRDYEQFRTDERVRRWIDSDRVHRNSRTADSDIAQSGMSWEHAVMFCQWLNEREKVPESEWCYLNIWDADKPIAPAPDYVNRTGYRLPTLAEWIWICGAGSKEPWHWGSDGSLAAYYEWTMPHSAGIVHEVERSRPNVFGLFDISGNVSEIIDSRIRPPYRPNQGFAYVDVSNADPKSLNEKALALGGRYRATASEAVTLKRVSFLPDEVSYSNGFRVVRTKSRD